MRQNIKFYVHFLVDDHYQRCSDSLFLWYALSNRPRPLLPENYSNAPPYCAKLSLLKQYINILFGLPSRQSTSLFLVSCRCRHWRERRREFTLLPYLCPIFHENDWDRNQYYGNAPQQRLSPLHAHACEHVIREKRKSRAGKGAQKGVCGYCGGGARSKD